MDINYGYYLKLTNKALLVEYHHVVRKYYEELAKVKSSSSAKVFENKVKYLEALMQHRFVNEE